MTKLVAVLGNCPLMDKAGNVVGELKWGEEVGEFIGFVPQEGVEVLRDGQVFIVPAEFVGTE